MSALEDIKEDAALARSGMLQLKLLSAAYESEDEDRIDQAIYRITTVRRMLANGMLDVIEAAAGAEEKDSGDGGASDN
ncbi:hypothetical protein [uncultured Roseobacter sp.]|uniref:hypothetical protein n=1 Tax=uncultured Roseobacter sp. TaxID=114847 RepID=UPI00262EB7F3|nr:hypothetical protein [uncultured Roseobacter sp.]